MTGAGCGPGCARGFHVGEVSGDGYARTGRWQTWPTALIVLANADDADPAALATPAEVIDGGPWRGVDGESWLARFRRIGDPLIDIVRTATATFRVFGRFGADPDGNPR